MEHIFIEPNDRRGWVEVVCGSMFSGKTEELIRRLRRAQFAKQRVVIFKPKIDTRYAESDVVSHNSTAIPCEPVDSAQSILLYVDSGTTDVVGIDEAQFFDSSLIEVCRKLADDGIRVIVAGLDMDFLGNPFGPIPTLMAQAEYVTKVQAICVQCGNPALYSFRTAEGDKLVLLGEKEAYIPLCRHCYNELMSARNLKNE